MLLLKMGKNETVHKKNVFNVTSNNGKHPLFQEVIYCSSHWRKSFKTKLDYRKVSLGVRQSPPALPSRPQHRSHGAMTRTVLWGHQWLLHHWVLPHLPLKSFYHLCPAVLSPAHVLSPP